MNKTLVLNASYEPMKIVSWKKAITLYLCDKVEILETYDEYIATPNLKIKKPAVVRYKYLIRPKVNILRFTRRHVYARDNYMCAYCGIFLTYNSLTLDHVFPRSRGGKTWWTNCVSCCVRCNVRKANKTPNEADMKMLYEPKIPTLSQMFLLVMRTKIDVMPFMWRNYCPEDF